MQKLIVEQKRLVSINRLLLILLDLELNLALELDLLALVPRD
jgi:hypothetical protein